ncbi:MAG: TSUP family transporter, partial [Candidatus Poribacteria bacterium]
MLILVTGSFAGFINMIAAGGSLVTLPLLIFLGLPAAMANGTNRIAIFVQNATGIVGFRRKGVSQFRYGILLALPASV